MTFNITVPDQQDPRPITAQCRFHTSFRQKKAGATPREIAPAVHFAALLPSDYSTVSAADSLQLLVPAVPTAQASTLWFVSGLSPWNR